MNMSRERCCVCTSMEIIASLFCAWPSRSGVYCRFLPFIVCYFDLDIDYDYIYNEQRAIG